MFGPLVGAEKPPYSPVGGVVLQSSSLSSPPDIHIGIISSADKVNISGYVFARVIFRLTDRSALPSGDESVQEFWVDLKPKRSQCLIIRLGPVHHTLLGAINHCS